MKVLRDSILYKNTDHYSAFTCLTRCLNGDILVAFRLAPNETPYHHHHSMSRAVIMRSCDEGETWSEPVMIAPDDDIGQQDPHITTLSDGSIFASYFTWQAHPMTEKPTLFDAYGELAVTKGAIWRCCGVHYAISKDHGYTWTNYGKLIPKGAGCEVYANAAMHSKAVEFSGKLLLPIRVEAPDSYKHYLVESYDKGVTWNYVTEIIRANPEKHHYYDEGYLYLSPDGTLTCLFRCYDEGGLMEYCSSRDGGVTWSEPVMTTIWGFPQTITPISGNRAFLTYGYRREPHGVRAKILKDDLSDLDEAPEIVVYDGGNDVDIGYPSGLELKNGNLLVTYYCIDLPGDTRVIKCAVLGE